MGMEGHRRKAARRILAQAGYRVGGHLDKHLDRREDEEADKRMVEKAVHAHERHDHKGEPLTKLKLAAGGIADGSGVRARPDRAGRGKKPQTSINIMVMPDHGGAGGPGAAVPVPVPVPHPVAPPMPPGGMPPGALPPRPPMPMPAAPGGMGAPMAPPMLRKRGGRAQMAHLDAGKGSGVGRRELSREMARAR